MAATPIIIPQNTEGMGIEAQSGGFVMTGYTASLLLQLVNATDTGPTVTLPLTVASDGLSGTYTTVGNEFATAGLYNAQLKVTEGGTLLYSLVFYRLVQIQAVLG